MTLLVAPTTEKGMIEEMRTILTFLSDNLKNFTPLYVDDAYRKKIRGYVAKWRWYISHSYFKSPTAHLDKPPIAWLYNLLVTHRSVNYMVSLLATPRLTPSTDAKNAADILRDKMSRILTYVEPVEIPSTFYLPPSHPDKTDQEGVLWAKSMSKAAKKYRSRLNAEKRALESLEPKDPYMKTPAELKAYLKAKEDRRAYERASREEIQKELIKRTKSERRRQQEHGNKP